MSLSRHTSHLSAVTAAALASLVGIPVAAALAQNSTASRVGSETAGAASFREKLILSEASIKGLTESLAVANGETELFKRKYDDLNMRVEALGIAPPGKEEEALRARLLAAVRDMRLLQKENDATREQMVRLTEVVMDLLKTSDGIDAKTRLKVEQELRSSAALTASKNSASSTTGTVGLTSGMVVDYKPDLALVVANLGARQGVKTGMPFQIWHGDRQIASARVVDVRDAISGAIVQNATTTSDTVKPGDTFRIDTTR
ncbi:MAG: hypothetical protein WCP60_04215 [bacterium]